MCQKEIYGIAALCMHAKQRHANGRAHKVNAAKSRSFCCTQHTGTLHKMVISEISYSVVATEFRTQHHQQQIHIGRELSRRFLFGRIRPMMQFRVAELELHQCSTFTTMLCWCRSFLCISVRAPLWQHCWIATHFFGARCNVSWAQRVNYVNIWNKDTSILFL